MPITAVVGDGGGWSGVAGRSALVGLTGMARDDCFGDKFSASG